MSETLKPFPICGGYSDYQEFSATNCHGRIICACGLELRQGKDETRDDITIIWNTRAEQTCELQGCEYCKNCGVKVVG